MVRAGRARRLWAWRFWYVAFRLGLVRFDWASLGKAVLACFGSVSRGKARSGMVSQGGLGLMRRGTERCGLVGQGGYGLMWSGEFWLNMACSGMAVEASSDMACQGGVGFGWAVLAR